MKYFLHFLISAAIVYFIAGSGLVPGITLANGYESALLFSVVLAIVNLVLGTVLRVISFPLAIITLGLISFVIWGVLIYVTDQLVPTVTLTGFIPVVVLAFTLSIASFFLRIFD